MARRLLLMCVFLAGLPDCASAQRLPVRLWSAPIHFSAHAASAAPLAPLSFSSPLADSAAIRPTHWLLGGAIGGVIIGALGTAFAAGLCGMSDTGDGGCGWQDAVLGFAAGGAVGFTIGALIGGAFPKRSP